MAEPIFERPQYGFYKERRHRNTTVVPWGHPFMHYVYTDMVTSENHAPVHNLQQTTALSCLCKDNYSEVMETESLMWAVPARFCRSPSEALKVRIISVLFLQSRSLLAASLQWAKTEKDMYVHVSAVQS